MGATARQRLAGRALLPCVGSVEDSNTPSPERPKQLHFTLCYVQLFRCKLHRTFLHPSVHTPRRPFERGPCNHLDHPRRCDAICTTAVQRHVFCMTCFLVEVGSEGQRAVLPRGGIANYWAPRTRKRHQQEHRPQRPTESSDPTQHAKGRTGDRPGPRKGAITRRNVTQGGG